MERSGKDKENTDILSILTMTAGFLKVDPIIAGMPGRQVAVWFVHEMLLVDEGGFWPPLFFT